MLYYPLRKFVVWVKEDRQTMGKPEDEKADVDHEQGLGQFDCLSPVSEMTQQRPLLLTWVNHSSKHG